MIIESIIKEIENYLQEILTYYNIDPIIITYEISEPPVREFGDFSTNIAFGLSKILKKDPFQIAKEITEVVLPESENWKKRVYIDSMVTQAPGFINLKVDNEIWLNEFIHKAYESKEIIRNRDLSDVNETILIEHTSVNPNKALHVGHLRNAIIGDCLYRMFKKAGKNVKVLNYIDDSGLQVADIVVGLKYANIPIPNLDNSLKPESKFDHYCGNEVYVRINELYSSRPDLLEKRKLVLKELEDPNSSISNYTHKIVMRVLADQLQTSWNLKCRYDLMNFESQIVQSDLWKCTFETLKDKKVIAFEENGTNKGCWVYKSSSAGDKVLVRSDSTLTYFAKDIPYAMWKLGHLGNPFKYEFYSCQWDSTNLYATALKEFTTDSDENAIKDAIPSLINFSTISKVITIIDSRQERLQLLMNEILIKLGIPVSKYQYLGYEPVLLSKNTLEMLGITQEKSASTHMSGRKGIFIEADVALTMLEQKSFSETMKRNPDLSEPEGRYISKSIAISSIRYYFIKFDFGKMITFDITESLSLDGDTAPYIQYAYARGLRVDTKASIMKITEDIGGSNYFKKIEFTSIETDLIRQICRYSMTLDQAIKKSNPKIIAKYLFQLATLFNNFYDKSPILSDTSRNLARNRIIVLRSALTVMKECMDIIGITALNRM